MLPAELAFGTPRKLPKVKRLSGKVVVLDVAFAGLGGKAGFEKVTLPFITGLGPRLCAWVDHHDHDEHVRFVDDPRFVLRTKAQHGACPEMITPELVERMGPYETVVCHNDFDGLASAAKWMLGGEDPYAACDADAHAIDTRIGCPGPIGDRFDRALRGRPRDAGLQGLIVRHLYTQLSDDGLWQPSDEAAAELVPVERETRRAADGYRVYEPGVAFVNIVEGFSRTDRTALLLMGQERAAVSVVLDKNSVAVAAAFDSGFDFVKMLKMQGGMPTRISVPAARLGEVLGALGMDKSAQRACGVDV